jgi:hypothetical protein
MQANQFIFGLAVMLASISSTFAQPTAQVPDKAINGIDTSIPFGPPKVQSTEVKIAFVTNLLTSQADSQRHACFTA